MLTILRDLKALGLRIAMDDFGTGYSSLSYLRRFPFDKVKIDRSFINDLGKGGDAAAIVRAIISLGRTLGMCTNAEGVETRDQAMVLQKEGCQEVQGFLFGRPASAASIAQLVEEYEKVVA
jgi:EAL domain-containing protein (putative c-di-GMP-specific phosphodiesterase class I)